VHLASASDPPSAAGGPGLVICAEFAHCGDTPARIPASAAIGASGITDQSSLRLPLRERSAMKIWPSFGSLPNTFRA